MTPRVLKVSTANAAYQRIEVLRRNRVKRHQYGEFVIEGVRAINAALAAEWTVRSFAFAAERPLSRWASDILQRSAAESHLEMEPALFESLTDKTDPPELLAVVATRPEQLDRIPIGPGLLVVVIDRPNSPGNLGTIVRSCDAFGAHGVIVSGHGVDLYDPLTVRASVGSFFAVPSVSVPSYRDVGAWIAFLRRARPGLQVVGSSAAGPVPIRETAWSEDTVLVIGNETDGLSHNYRGLCDVIVRIPMRGTATSLNAAVAASILLCEVSARRA